MTIGRSGLISPGGTHRVLFGDSSTWAKNLVLLLYLLLLFEGALRKWVAPQWFQPLFFVKDPVVIALYFCASKNLWASRGERWMLRGLWLVPPAVAIAVIKALEGHIPSEIVLYGFRNYFLYMPLPIVLANVCGADDWRRIVRVTFVLSLPVAALVIWQFNSPANDPVNAGLIAGGLAQAGVFGERVRTYGLFTSSPGQNMYNTALLLMVVWAWLVPRKHHDIGTSLRVIATAAALASLSLSGSRSAFIQTGAVIALSAIALMRTGALAKARFAMTVLGLCAIAVYAVPAVFPDAVDAMLSRTRNAAAQEETLYTFGTIGRIIANFTAFAEIVPEVPVEGFGIGTFGNANADAAADYVKDKRQPEDDWSRNVAELGPLLGMAFIVWRIVCVGQLWRIAVRGLSGNDAVLVVLLVSFVTTTFLAGQMTGHGSIHGYTWIFSGLFLSAARVSGVTRVRTANYAPPVRFHHA